MTDRVWHKGAPPHVGWWNATRNGFKDLWRWWDGSAWGSPAYSDDPGEKANALAHSVAPNQWEILWSDYWPENARVPRIDPRTMAQKGHHEHR